jgi:UV DNA damage endonuclease
LRHRERSVLARLGFVASVLSEDLTTSRTCRLRNATDARLRELIAENLSALDRVVLFLERQRIRLYRISSNLVPFASHHINAISWWSEYADVLSQIGRRLRRLGIRVSTHPGQYTVLNSPHPSIVSAAVSEIVYHARLLDALGVNSDGKIVVHVGGLYGASEREAMDRFIATTRALPRAVRRRIVVENDDHLFDADEVLEVGRAVGIPVVFDWLHHKANPCRRSISKVLPEIFATWRRSDGRPEIHLSSQAAHAPSGAHADFVDPHDFIDFLRVAPQFPFDCMLEAKQKDRALVKLRRDLRARGIVETDIGGAVRRRAGAS